MSVVSHGHEKEVAALLAQLALHAAGQVRRVVVTHNLPPRAPLAPGPLPFALVERVNPHPLGFGANHNRALARDDAPLFCILNPDIALADAALFADLARRAAEPGVGCAYPVLLDPDGSVQRSERDLLTPWSLVRRHLLRIPPRRVDWVSGAFWVVPAPAWRQLGGFDERYFMYCEDADFCLRLQLAGWRLARVDRPALHEAAHASRRPGRALAWHLASLLRLWLSPAFRRYLLRRTAPGAGQDARGKTRQ